MVEATTPPELFGATPIEKAVISCLTLLEEHVSDIEYRFLTFAVPPSAQFPDGLFCTLDPLPSQRQILNIRVKDRGGSMPGAILEIIKPNGCYKVGGLNYTEKFSEEDIVSAIQEIEKTIKTKDKKRA